MPGYSVNIPPLAENLGSNDFMEAKQYAAVAGRIQTKIGYFSSTKNGSTAGLLFCQTGVMWKIF